ncbi:MAG TPA: CusA/CzcA family heavy metal efflux RND transporter [Xanthobacteraceae bacterium]|nr:CusA/CzcA family heavy metal efflux RND transporter [Xanthobacteraceae bacterium]
MINWFVGYALRTRLVVAMICIFAAIYGYYSWTQLAVEAYPDIADTSSQVVTQAPGMAAEEVEQRITIPLERELNGTPGLLFMRSKSTFGLSLITIVFRDGIEKYWARQRINERIQAVTLPSGITAGLDPVTSPTGQIYYYTLESDTKGQRELSEIQRWIVIPALKQVPGVADVSNFGGITTQFQLELDPQQLARFNLSLANVESAINANSSNAGGSVVARGDLGFVIRAIGFVQSLDDLGAIVVTQRNGTPIFLRDLGRLKLANLERHGIVGKNQQNDVIEGTVLLLKDDNPSRVLEGIHAKVAELNERLAADDVQIVPYYDRSDLVDQTVSKVSHTILQGIGLVLLVLILFLGSPRSALIVGITIPFAMVTVFVLMNLFKISANLLSLGAIDFGIIVDAAIVVTDAILRRREANPDERLTEEDAVLAANQVARPIFFATLIIITTYMPLFAFQRLEAKLFYPMVYAVGFAQFGALLLALSLVPGLAYVAYRKPRRVFHNYVLGWIEAGYRRALQGLLHRPGIAYLLAAGAAVTVVALATTVPREFLPDLDEGGLFLHGEMVGGISLAKASKMDADLREAVLEFPEVSTVVNHIGRNDDGTDPNTPSHLEMLIVLHPYDTWPSGESKEDLIRRMKARLAELPGYELAVSQPILDSIKDKIFEPHSQLAARIYGDDFDELRRIGKDVATVLKATSGTAEVLVDDRPPLGQITITADREAAARYGINVADITDLIQTGIGGGAVSQVFIGERHYDTTVRFPEAVRSSPEAIGRLPLTSSSGALIPLSQVARIKLQQGESTINRDMNRRYLMVKFDSAGRSLPALLANAKRAVAEKVSFDPRRYHIEWVGHFEDEQRAEARFVLILGLILGLMIVLLYAEFGLLRQVILILGVVPLATLGGLIALHITGVTLNVASGVGFIALFGVAVMNGVIMVANLNRVCDLGIPLMEAVVIGASERLRPVLMTATVATVGMLPAATATGVGSDVQRSLATVVAGGLLVATLMTLFLLPTTYFVIERLAARFAGAGAREAPQPSA